MNAQEEWDQGMEELARFSRDARLALYEIIRKYNERNLIASTDRDGLAITSEDQ